MQRWASSPQPNRLRRTLPFSILLHATLVAAPLAWLLLSPRPPAPPPLPKPDEQPQVELLIGDGGRQTGAAPPAAAAPPDQPAPSPPVPDPPKTEPPKAEPPKPEPPEQVPPTPEPLKPPEPQPAPAPPPPPTPPPPPRPPSPPPLPPGRPAPPAVHLGDGLAGNYAVIESPLDIVKAGPDARNTPPEYPLEAARRHEQGTVVTAIHIDDTGAVSEVVILRSSGSSRLDQAAQIQLRTWHFRPAIKDGRPIASEIEQSIEFKP